MIFVYITLKIYELMFLLIR